MNSPALQEWDEAAHHALRALEASESEEERQDALRALEGLRETGEVMLGMLRRHAGDLIPQIAAAYNEVCDSLEQGGVWRDADLGRRVRGDESRTIIPRDRRTELFTDLEMLRDRGLSFTAACRDLVCKYDLNDDEGRSLRRFINRERPDLKW